MPPAASRLRGQATDGATTWAFRSGWRIVRRLPEPAAQRLFDRVADTTWARRGPSVRQLERNLSRAVPGATPTELRELSRDAMRSYMRYWQEAFRLPSWSPERILSTMRLDGHELLDAAVDTGSGAVMTPGHMANWDHAGAWAALRYGSVVTVAERLKPEAVFAEFLDYRRSLGMVVHGLGDDGIVRTLSRAADDGQIVALVGDRDIGRNGIVVDLLGEPASLPAGPALLSVMTGAPLHPVGMWFDGPMTRAFVYPQVPVPEGLPRGEQVRVMTQGLADALGEAIRAHPVDWHMLQPVWLADLDDSRMDEERRELARIARARRAERDDDRAGER